MAQEFTDDGFAVLPSQVHPSYPYGNPTHAKHPASLPRRPYDPSSRALFEDMGYAGGGVNGSLRWKDLALDLLLPVDEDGVARFPIEFCERTAMRIWIIRTGGVGRIDGETIGTAGIS